MTNTVQHLGGIGIRRRAANRTLALAILLLSAFVTTRAAHAQGFTVLYSFTERQDGNFPVAELIGDPAGNLYSTTAGGGKPSCFDGCGTVFKLDATGNETVLHRFAGADGASPGATLIRDPAGNFYGTTYLGGEYGIGTVFKLNMAGKFKVLHSFGGSDGANPTAGLIRDAAGNLLGTTTSGGDLTCNAPDGCGTVFKLDATGNETVLYRFTGENDGASPQARLVRDAAGNLYGTTLLGGASHYGTVFKLDAAGKETVLHSFASADRALPYGGLVKDSEGNLYGTTYSGGAYGMGTVFKLDSTGKETVLHSFAGADGRYPLAGLIRDPSGNFYGTTDAGGAFDAGTVFKLNTAGKFKVLHSCAYADGTNPQAGLIRDAAGNLYGTTSRGGDNGRGTVFKLAP